MNGRPVMLMNECQSRTAIGKRLSGPASAVAIALLFGISAPTLAAQGVDSTTMESPELRIGEVIYVPVYSHIFQGDKASKQPLSSTLVIHNVDPSKPIQVTSVRYYDHSGAQIKEYTDQPLTLGPFASANFVVGIGEDRGGVGANFLVEWQAEETLVSPIVQAIMSGGTGTQGLSFVTQGKVIEIRR
ncbi:DUF3124 domain-containing protein [Thiocapsa bogorovii]|uniref:DUF3124 domain-containing protein n=1 Tax=Thiocapsa bogorovii TaxID=521689 RepID=UPI001E3C5299|nr:DUF3124 domain-containing protein [Thiocapsa bogorovii]UHD15677.1 DUF3124 domain-containing protein [Thiocapsa bogorovii]